MIKQLITFDGGLSTKASPSLIQPNEAIECNNVDIEDGSLKTVRGSIYDLDVTGLHGYYVDGSYIFNMDTNDDRFYVEFANSLYWSNGSFNSNGMNRYDGTYIGVNADPPLSPNQISTTTIAGGNLEDNIDYLYCYTFVDGSYLEGKPSVFSGSSTSVGNNQIQIDISPTNVPADATQVRIYRTGGDNPTFNLVGEIDIDPIPVGDPVTNYTINETFIDNTRDIDVARIELTSFVDSPAPSNLDMLIENNGTFWGVVGDRVYFSRSGSPYFWGELDYVRLDSQCTGLGKIGNSIIAFTISDMYKIDGWHRDNIYKEKLEFNQGCKNKRTVANVNNYLFWVSDNGICLYDGGTVAVVTKNIISWDEFARVGVTTWEDYQNEKWNSGLGFEITYAKSFQDKYYGVYADGVVVIDVSNGVRASTLYDEGISSLVYNKLDNVLSYVQEYIDINGKTDISFDALSKTISSTSSKLDVYSNGSTVEITGSTLNNGFYTIVSSTENSIVVSEALVDELAGDSIVITKKSMFTMFSDTTHSVGTWKTGELADEGITIRKFYRKINIIGDLGDDNEIKVIIDGEQVISISDTTEFFLPAGSHGYTIQFDIRTNGELNGIKYEYSIGKL